MVRNSTSSSNFALKISLLKDSISAFSCEISESSPSFNLLAYQKVSISKMHKRTHDSGELSDSKMTSFTHRIAFTASSVLAAKRALFHRGEFQFCMKTSINSGGQSGRSSGDPACDPENDPENDPRAIQLDRLGSPRFSGTPPEPFQTRSSADPKKRSTSN